MRSREWVQGRRERDRDRDIRIRRNRFFKICQMMRQKMENYWEENLPRNYPEITRPPRAMGRQAPASAGIPGEGIRWQRERWGTLYSLHPVAWDQWGKLDLEERDWEWAPRVTEWTLLYFFSLSRFPSPPSSFLSFLSFLSLAPSPMQGMQEVWCETCLGPACTLPQNCPTPVQFFVSASLDTVVSTWFSRFPEDQMGDYI